jgi:hypothetical protein
MRRAVNMFVSAAEYERVNANKKDASDILKAIKKHKRKPTDESKRK